MIGGRDHGHAEQIGLELHQQLVAPRRRRRRAARPGVPGVGVMALDSVGGLEGDGLQRGAGEVAAVVPRVRPMIVPARVGIPVRRAEPGEGGHEIDAAVGSASRPSVLDLRGLRDEPEAVAQPLHGGAGDEDAALQRIVDLVADPPGHVVSRPWSRSGEPAPVFISRKQPVP